MRIKWFAVLETALQILIVVLCFVYGWASLKNNVNYELWTRPTFSGGAVFWMPNETAMALVGICAALASVLSWTKAEIFTALPVLCETAIFLRTWFEIAKDSYASGTGYLDGNMLPLGIAHCCLAVLTLLITVVGAAAVMKKRKNGGKPDAVPESE